MSVGHVAVVAGMWTFAMLCFSFGGLAFFAEDAHVSDSGFAEVCIAVALAFCGLMCAIFGATLL